MSGQLLDMYVVITAVKLAHWVQDEVVNCTSVNARYMVQNGDATYCAANGDAVVPAWGPTLMSAVVENAADTNVVITYDMAMAVTDGTGYVLTVDGVEATINSASASGSTITLVLSASITNAEALLLSYDFATGNAENTNGTADTVAEDTVDKTTVNNVAV